MKKLLHFLALGAMLCIPWVTQGQDLADYTFSTGTDANQWITLSGSATELLSSSKDDNASSKTNIGFTFPFGDNSYTQFWVSSNGVFSFSSSTSTSGSAGQFTSTYLSNAQPKICGVAKDLTTGSDGYVKYELTGTAPNRVLVCEFFTTNSYTSGYSSTAATCKWQVQLHESDSKVVIIYGAIPSSSPSSYQIGLSQSTSDIWTVNPSTHEATHATGAVSTTYNVWPGENRYYAFERPVISCPKPTDFACTATSGTPATAIFSWTNGGTETDWVLEYSIASDFTGATSINISSSDLNTDGSYTITSGLTAETEYYAHIKADCGGSDESDWSNTSTFKPSNVQNIPIGSGENTTNYFPTHPNWKYSYTQQIYTATEIGQAGTIKSISFKGNKAGTRSLVIYMANTTKETFSSSTDVIPIADATQVFSGSVTFTANEWKTIELADDGFNYDGDNLAIIVDDNSGNYTMGTTSWAAFNASSDQALYYYQDSPGDINPSSPSASYNNLSQLKNQIKLGILLSTTPKPKNLTVSAVTATTATVTWVEPNIAPERYEYQYKESSVTDWPVAWTTNSTNLSVTLNPLGASTTYDFRVRAVYSEGESDPVEIQFTTLDNCAFPTNLTASTTPGQGTKATLSWTKGYDETEWELQYSTDNFVSDIHTVTEGFTIDGNTVTANLTGLTAEESYSARVKAVCGATSSSSWSVFDEFNPTNFVDYTYNSGATSSTSYHPFNGYYATSTTNQSQFVIPAAELVDVAGGTIRSITYYTSNTSTTTDWGGVIFDVYMAEVENSTFSSATFVNWDDLTNVYTGTVSLSNGMMTITLDQEYTYNGGNLLIGFKTNTAGTAQQSISWTASYRSDKYNIVYQYSSNSASRTYYFPKITFNYRPTATPRPIITEPVTTTDVTATIAWTKPSDNVTGYKYQYKLAADTWSDDWTNLNDADVLSVMLPGLTPNSSYNFRMKAVYGTEESFVSSTSFVTECPAATAVPYSYGFETASEFSCWEVIAGAAIADHTSNQPTHDGTTGSKHLKFSGTTSNMVALPAFGEATNTLRITLWTRPENITNSSCGSFSIGYMTNLADASTFTPIATYDYDDWSEFEYEKKIVDFNDPNDNVPANAYIALCQHDCSSSWYWFVDDVKVKVIPTCEDVDNVTASNVTNHSATIAWTADAAQSAWQIAYKADANFNPNDATELATATVVDVTSNPYLFDKNLEAATTYYMYVRGNCTASSNGYGDWSDSYATFTTVEAAPVPSNFTASNPASQTVNLEWTAGGGDYEESWELYYVASTTAPEAPIATTEATKIVNVLPTTLAPYELTGLTAETKYYIWVRANHGTDGKSAWVALTGDFFNTLAACSAMDPMVSDITHHNAIVTWDGESADDFTVNYRTAATLASDGLTENFESGAMPNGWTTEGPGTWSVGTGDYDDATGAHGGTYNAKINHGTTGNETYLITPNLDLSARSDLKVNLWYINRKWGGDLDGFGVYYRVNGGAWNEIFATTTATTAWTEINEDLPTGAYAANCQFGFKFTDGYGYGVGIDDITIGTPSTIPAGSWQTQAATTTTADLTGLTAGTKYDLKVVPNCDETLESSTVQFTTLPANNKYFLTAGDWNTASNWMDEEMPTTTDNAIIRANATIPNGTVATAKNITFEGTPTPTLTLADGGQLIAGNSVNLTVQKNATANSWMGIAAPVFYSNSSKSLYYTSTNLKGADAYDLMQYAEDNSTWQSQKTPSYMSQERGYIYRRAADAMLTFTGSTHVGEQSADNLVTFSASDASLKGFNLIGNPYPHAIYYGAAIPTTNLAEGFYILQTNGTWRTVAGADINTTAIGVGEAIMVKASADISPFVMTDVATAPTSSKAHTATLAFTVRNDEYSDVAYAMFSNGEGLPKMSHLNAEAPMLYIPTDEGRYAIAMMEESVESFPLNFNGYGEYTLSVNNSTAFDYLHLIDRATGRDIDLLSQSTYTFNANGSSDRFTVKLSPSTEENGRAIFVWQENGNVVVEGDGDLQVFDVMGRQTGTTHVDGTTTFSRGDLGMSHSGVYVLRLNGNSQKIVVK